jgi:hypothetical protein
MSRLYLLPLVLLCFIIPKFAQSQGVELDMQLGAHNSKAIFNHFASVQADDGTGGGGFNVQIGLTAQVKGSFNLRSEFAYMMTDTYLDISFTSDGVDGGQLQRNDWLFNKAVILGFYPEYRYRSGNAQLLAFAGPNLTLPISNSAHLDQTNQPARFTPPGLKAGVGARFFVNDHVGFACDLSYLFVSPSSVLSGTSLKVGYHVLNTSGGVVYRFGKSE